MKKSRSEAKIGNQNAKVGAQKRRERWKQEAAFDKLAPLLGKYIESLGGTAVVVGGTKVGQEAGSLAFNYFIKFNVTGRIPQKETLT